jgi:hypothetical protein
MRTPAYILSAVLLATAGASPAAGSRGAVKSSFLYSLNDGAGRKATGWASLNWDARGNELFVVSGGVVDIFDDNGLPTYSFGDDAGFGSPVAVAALDSGEIFVLAAGAEGATSLVRCNFRGEPQARVALAGIPKEFTDGFNPTAIAVQAGNLYLADKNAMKVLVVSPDGRVSAAHDLAQLIGLGPRERGDAMMRGFAVDDAGNLLFTVASTFSAYVVSPKGKARVFGSKGSSPGKFNIVSGIAADEEGRLFLTDSLRSVVMVFDSAFRFLGEFGYRGPEPENLTGPLNLAVGNGRVYVSQSRGAVKAFAVRFD